MIYHNKAMACLFLSDMHIVIQVMIYQTQQANLRDLIAAIRLVILIKLDSNHRIFGAYDLEIWWMTSTNNRVPLLWYVKFCASFQSH